MHLFMVEIFRTVIFIASVINFHVFCLVIQIKSKIAMQIFLLIRNFLRFCLVVVGDMSTLEQASQDLWGELIRDARSRGRYL